MSGPLADRHVVIGVSGSIAAYKAAEVVSRLVQAGARVDVAMTRGATQFIQPLTFRALPGLGVEASVAVDGTTRMLLVGNAVQGQAGDLLSGLLGLLIVLAILLPVMEINQLVQ